MTLRIMDEYFEELINGIRECDDPEEISVKVCDAEGNSIVYQGGCLYIVSQDTSLRVPLDQLPPFQRLALEQVLVEHVERIVDNIVSGAIDVD
jgi:hypothetical protein